MDAIAKSMPFPEGSNTPFMAETPETKSPIISPDRESKPAISRHAIFHVYT
jgi:hypothetical protein